jgi:hypothetical protein
MVIVNLKGGLGNQMFQYAAAKALAVRLGVPLAADLDLLLDRTPRANAVFRDYDLDLFGLPLARASPQQLAPFRRPGRTRWQRLKRRLYCWPRRIYYRERNFNFDADLLRARIGWGGGVYLDGYWQSPRYFQSIQDEVRRDFTFRHVLSSAAAGLLHQIASTESVLVSVRRTDYLNNDLYRVCTERYFNLAVAKMSVLLRRPRFYVFGDDLDWCRHHFSQPERFTVVGPEYAGPKFGTYLQLMTACRHAIIANSTFAWWAAWLNPQPGKVVMAPAVWFSDRAPDNCRTVPDLIPESWKRVEG